MPPFDMPGGWRIIPERGALMECETWDEARALFAEADEILKRISKLRVRLRDAYREQRRLQVAESKARRRLDEERRTGFSQETEDAAREAVEEAVEALNAVTEEIQDTQKEWEELGTRFQRKFVAVSVEERSVPDLSMPDKKQEQDSVVSAAV